jgi:hypothetical protein
MDLALVDVPDPALGVAALPGSLVADTLPDAIVLDVEVW